MGERPVFVFCFSILNLKSTLSHLMRSFDPHETAQMQLMAGKRLASFGSRAAAFLLDMAIGTLFCYTIVTLIAVLDYKIFHSGPPGESFMETLIREMVDTGFASQKHGGEVVVDLSPHLSVFTAVSIAICVAMMNFFGNGKTVGKWVVGIRAVSLVHEHLTVWQSIERALGYSVSIAEAGFGFLQYFIHPNRRTVHDRIAETIVIKDRGA